MQVPHFSPSFNGYNAEQVNAYINNLLEEISSVTERNKNLESENQKLRDELHHIIEKFGEKLFQTDRDLNTIKARISSLECSKSEPAADEKPAPENNVDEMKNDFSAFAQELQSAMKFIKK